MEMTQSLMLYFQHIRAESSQTRSQVSESYPLRSWDLPTTRRPNINRMMLNVDV
jgi:hypothetical protein